MDAESALSGLSRLSDARLLTLRAEAQERLEGIDAVLRQRQRAAAPPSPSPSPGADLSNREIARYSRHLLLPDFGMSAQAALRGASFLLVGCGGLGCPAAQYLAACGAGKLGLVDFDVVEESNLHRQVLHREDSVGVNKAESVRRAVRHLNSFVQVETFEVSLDSSNALDIVRKFDVVLDCTDNVATRYLLNDACVMAGKPLVSGSALRFEGQLTVYNYKSGPTYRCLFPSPPPPETVTNCSDGGVVGVVPGVIGVLQALEAIKVAAGVGEVLSGRLLIFDGFTGRFRTVKLRDRTSECASVTGLIDYRQFCGASAHDKDEPLSLLAESDRISVHDLKQRLERDDAGDATVVIDVRSAPEMDICALPSSVNVPLDEIGRLKGDDKLRQAVRGKREVVFLCRRGNDSQRALQKTREMLKDVPKVVDVKGGLHAWAKDIDSGFPVY